MSSVSLLFIFANRNKLFNESILINPSLNPLIYMFQTRSINDPANIYVSSPLAKLIEPQLYIYRLLPLPDWKLLNNMFTLVSSASIGMYVYS
jgi:hypothetical protein